LSENTKGFEDIRIAVAGLERIGKKSPKTQEWLKEVGELKIPGDASGPTSGAARQAGSLIVTNLRLGGKYESTDQLIKTLKAGQRDNGGYGKDGTMTSDLETTYRVMRAFHMLKAKPGDVEGMRSFVAKCRNDDGGYGISPGQPSNVAATYFAAIIKHWLNAK
jgi:prenyltransferase beta subunit